MKELSLQLHYPHRHGGIPIAIGIKVEMKEGEGSVFVIALPTTVYN